MTYTHSLSLKCTRPYVVEIWRARFITTLAETCDNDGDFHAGECDPCIISTRTRGLMRQTSKFGFRGRSFFISLAARRTGSNFDPPRFAAIASRVFPVVRVLSISDGVGEQGWRWLVIFIYADKVCAKAAMVILTMIEWSWSSSTMMGGKKETKTNHEIN